MNVIYIGAVGHVSSWCMTLLFLPLQLLLAARRSSSAARFNLYSTIERFKTWILLIFLAGNWLKLYSLQVTYIFGWSNTHKEPKYRRYHFWLTAKNFSVYVINAAGHSTPIMWRSRGWRTSTQYNRQLGVIRSRINLCCFNIAIWILVL